MAVTVRPLSDAVGVEILGVDLKQLDQAQFRVVERAWHENSVILLRNQKLDDDHLLAFSRRFGELDPPPNQERGRISPP
ncbi:MAG TPA: TauD/TfdA family dioxygenase, partial [Reyranella sp.]